MDIKTIFIIVSIIAELVAYIPYLKDILGGKTKPHLYTWIIWVLTQGTALAGIWFGGGGLGALSLAIGMFFSTAICIYSIKYGTKNITKSDKVILTAALLAIAIWWLFDEPVISVVMVSIIDLIGYFPSYRKSFVEPWSETLFSWFAFVVSNIFAFMALEQYNLLTVSYLFVISLANLFFFLLIHFRRKKVARPKPKHMKK